MPCPEISSSFIRGRMLPHDEFSPAHTPSFLDSHKSMASRERRAMPRKDGFRSMRSSSGSAGGGACDGPVPARGKEPRRCTGLSDARSRAQISCPGVFLPGKQDVYLAVYLLNQYLETDCFPSVFPIMIQQNMRFEKVFENAIDPGAVADILESFLTRFELIQQVPPGWAELAYYEENTRDFLFPEPKLTPSHPGMCREVLMKTVAGFPGIAPKIEFSTRTAIRECVFLHRNRCLEEKYKSRRSLSNSWRPPLPLDDIKVDSAKPFGEDVSEHHSRKSRRKSKFSNFPFPMRRASSFDSLAANIKVVKEPDERIVLRNESPSPLDSSKFGKPSPSYSDQGDADCRRETSFAASQHCRSPSPLLDQPLLRGRFHPSSQSTWKKIHERVCSLLTSHRAQQHLDKEDSFSKVNCILERPSYHLKKYPVHEKRYF
ncbi:spermatogenesis associated 6-like protein isoform X2 [Equus przewalskii]|uniref:Spermatogenesis associated 6-like protein isoform X2 n=1 Tax=Equus przewalskii TaxID=9798 RepID=A0ABM4M071_EQUPR|nr:spermatogenesis associated 6-like protein isoform X2 [Equus caballus]